jgi:periplasmic divalent cation tolerance protein
MAAVLVISTFSNPDQAAQAARTLVDEHLCACVNLVPGVRSIYRWQGAVCDEAETLVLIKTTRERQDALIARLVALHPYELAEAIAVAADGGSAAYLAWLQT